MSVIGQVSIPLYQGSAEEVGVRQAKENRNQADLNIAEAQRQVREAVHNPWQSELAAADALNLSRSQVQANNTAYKGSKLEAQVGTCTTLDNGDEFAVIWNPTD